MDRLDSTAVRVLRTILEGQPLSEAKVAFAWKIAAGPSLARATSLSWTEGRMLFVSAKSEAWRAEVDRALPLIRSRMVELLGPGVVRRVMVTTAPADPPGQGQRRHP